jgi:hypothetical protein
MRQQFQVDTASVRTSPPGHPAATPVGQWLAWARPRLASLAALVFAWCLLSLHPAARCAEEWEYTVQPGDTLWDLSERYLLDLSFLPRLQRLNRVADPKRLLPGTRLRFPVAWMKSTSPAARLVAVDGDVQIEHVSSSAQRKAVAGATLHAGDIVRTRAGGHAAVAFFDGSVLSLHSDSTLLLDVLRAYAAGLNTIRMELAPGRVETRVRAQPSQPSRFEIRTPAGITSVRGTDFRVSVPADEKLARTEVLAGEVTVAGAGKEVIVAAGHGTVVRAGEAPATPLALLPPPDLTGLPAIVVSLPAQIDFPAVSGAVAYRTQLARDTRFEQIVFEALSETPQVRLPELPNAHYVLRVRAVHVAGLEGHHAERLVELAVRPAPPTLIEPQDGAETLATPLRFRWDPANAGLIYRFQLARDATFSEPVEDLPALRDSGVILERALPSGVYYWRVAAAHPEQGEGPFGAARKLRRPPPAPVVERAELTPAQLQLRWLGDRPDRRYRVQLAREPEFTQAVIDTYADRPALELPRPVAGRYFLRIQAVEPDGYEGPYERPTIVDVHGLPAAPRLLQPADAAQVSSTLLEFRWEPVAASARYRFQLANNPAFDPLYVDASDLKRTGFTLERVLAPGSYFWRVAAITQSDGEGAFSEARVLRAPQPAQVPAPALPAPAAPLGPSWLLPLPFLLLP